PSRSTKSCRSPTTPKPSSASSRVSSSARSSSSTRRSWVDEVDALKARVVAEVDRRADLLLDASHRIHGRPELGFEEHHAHELLPSVLADGGLDTERGAYDVPTAFRATAGSGRGPTVAVLCEYDALPEIGHACGHNVIATAGVGAALASAAVADVAG